jgi:hypothetical protein
MGTITIWGGGACAREGCVWGRGEDEQGRGRARVLADSDMRGLVELARWAETSAGLAHSHGPDEARVWAVETEAREELMRGRVSNNKRYTDDRPARSAVQVSSWDSEAQGMGG